MAFSFEPLEFGTLKTYPLRERKNKVTSKDFARPYVEGSSFSAFLDTIPPILAGGDYREIVKAVIAAHRAELPVVVAMGAHVIKVGLSPLIIDLMKRGIINAVALNGAGSIHDAEIALIGETSEDVSLGIQTGTFGMVEETGRIVNEAAISAFESNRGLGEVLGRRLVGEPMADMSILAQGFTLGVPVTVHIAFGSDIVHGHPAARGEALGGATFNDFRLFCGIVSKLREGSVLMNIGSAVLLPTVIEKALAIARNMGHPVKGFIGVTMDFIRNYRSGLNPVQRARDLDGKGYTLIGHHELMVPLLAAGIIEGLGGERTPSL
jgi:hypothetical protein